MQISDICFANYDWVPWLATAMGVLGIALAWVLYGRKQTDVAAVLNTEDRPRWYQVVYDKFYIDDLWLWFSRTLIIKTFSGGLKWFDRNIIDGTMDLVGAVLQRGGVAVRKMQNGSVALYLGLFFTGLFLVAWFGNLPLK